MLMYRSGMGGSVAVARQAFLAAVALAGLGLCTTAKAVLPPDMGGEQTTGKLPAPPSKHWVWANDFVFPHMTDGNARLVDGDSGRFLGMLRTGFGFSSILLPRDGKLIYSPETYFSRGTRGTRTDVVTIYDAATLGVVGEVAVPPKHVSGIPTIGHAALTDDDRWVLIYNFTPAQSVSVVDTAKRTFVGEIETPGCAFVYPTGPHSFFGVCANGDLLTVELDAVGKASAQKRVDGAIDFSKDPITAKPVRMGDTWYFITFDGRIVPVQTTTKGTAVGEIWSLLSKDDRQKGWRSGGVQQMAGHAGQRRLYVLMHQGNRDTHKDPGKEVWVYDVATRQRVMKIPLRAITSSIQVSTDEKPLLFSAFIDGAAIDVYDARTGKHLRTIDNVSTSPTMLMTP